VSVDEPPPNIEKLATRLNDGLKTCHAMVSNYKALIGADQGELEPPADSDEPSPVAP
jgi:hypothetical protein